MPAKLFYFLLLTSVLEVGYQIPYYLSLRQIDTPSVVALFSLKRGLIPVLAFYILEEVLLLHNYIGFFIIVFSLLYLSFDFKNIKINKAFWLMFFVSLVLGFQSVLYKFNFESGISYVNMIFWPIFIEFVLASLLLVVCGGHRELKEKFVNIKDNKYLFGLNEMFNLTANSLSLYVLKLLPVTIAEALYSLQPIFVMFIQKIFLKNSKIAKESKDVSALKITTVSLLVSFGVFLVLV